jgi:hypothetical protein
MDAMIVHLDNIQQEFNGVKWTITNPLLLREAAVYKELEGSYDILFTRTFGTLLNAIRDDSEDDAITQLKRSYASVGGWRDFVGFKLGHKGKGFVLNYANDPPIMEVGRAILRNEFVVLFAYDWVAVLRAGTENVSRVPMRVSRVDRHAHV